MKPQGGSRGVTVTPNNTVQIAFTYDGRHYRERLTLPPTEPNLKYAARKRAAVLHDIECGIFDFRKHFPNSRRSAEPPGRTLPTVEAALRAYLRQQRRHLAESTLRDYRSAVHAHLIPEFGRHQLNELTVAEIRDWVAGLTISSQRINKILVPLRSVLGDAFSDELIERNPLARVRVPVRDARIAAGPDPLTPDEVSHILAQCDPLFGRVVACAIGSGLRTSELLGLVWDDVDLNGGFIEVRRALVNGIVKTPKTAAGRRRVQLMPLALRALRAQRTETLNTRGPVWLDPATGRYFRSSQQIRRAWKKVCERANVRYRRPYACRHTYASWLLSAGEDPSWIAGQLGHRDWSMIRRTYARWMPSVRPAAGRRGAQIFAGLLDPPGGLGDVERARCRVSWRTRAHRPADTQPNRPEAA